MRRNLFSNSKQYENHFCSRKRLSLLNGFPGRLNKITIELQIEIENFRNHRNERKGYRSDNDVYGKCFVIHIFEPRTRTLYENKKKFNENEKRESYAYTEMKIKY